MSKTPTPTPVETDGSVLLHQQQNEPSALLTMGTSQLTMHPSSQRDTDITPHHLLLASLSSDMLRLMQQQATKMGIAPNVVELLLPPPMHRASTAINSDQSIPDIIIHCYIKDDSINKAELDTLVHAGKQSPLYQAINAAANVSLLHHSPR